MGMTSGFESVESYLQKGIYHIPDYQREYSWIEDEQIEDFWIDLDNAVQEQRNTHFFGQIVVHDDRTQNKKYIIDGQQRTTTSVIFLSVLRDLFEQLFKESDSPSSRNKVEDIRLKFIGRWSEDENELRLTLGAVDAAYFRNHIQIQRPDDNFIPKEPSHKRIKQAYTYFEKKITSQFTDDMTGKDKYNILVGYLNKFKDDFKLMYVETDDMNEAFIIFETLNARGKDLETSDLLKNHLFRSAGNLIEEVKSEWMKTVDNLETIDFTKFLRHYWNSKFLFTREKDLYKRLRSHIDTPEKCTEFVRNLNVMSSLYKTLMNPEEELYFQNQEINKILSSLKLFNASTYYPIVLAMANRNYSEDDIKQILSVIETFIFRNCVVAGKVANKYEILFSQIAYNISQQKINSISEIYLKLKADMLPDDEFETAFHVLTVKKVPIAKYILRELNNITDQEVAVLTDNSKIHLEHIMPKKLGDWSIVQETHEKYLNRLGNLTLLANEYNKSISNKTFDKKKTIYRKSSIRLNLDLCEDTTWDETTIDKRQRKLFETAKVRWRLLEL